MIGMFLLPKVKYHHLLPIEEMAPLPKLKMVWQNIFQTPTVKKIFLLETLVGIFLVAQVVGLPYILVTNRYISAHWLGLVQGIIGSGSILGAAIAYSKNIFHPLKVLKYTTILMGILYLIQGLSFNLPTKTLIIISIIIINISISFIDTFTAPISYTVLQTSLTDDTRADILTWYYTFQELVYPIGSALISLLMVIISPMSLYLIYGSAIILISLVIMKEKH